MRETKMLEDHQEVASIRRDHAKAKSFVLSAVVGPGSSWTNAVYSFTLGGWTVHDRSSSMILFRQIPLPFEDTEIYCAVQDLENILLALFVNDRLPRKIFYFFYPNDLDKGTSLRLLFMLGQAQAPLSPDGIVATESYSSSGFMFNRILGQDWIPSNSTIEEWFHFFREKESFAGSIVLLQRSFWTMNGLYGQYRYYDYPLLCEAVVLMIAGLENLFVRDGSKEISAQFRRVGSAYYTERVPEDYFRDFSANDKKLTYEQVSKVLGRLYSIRSAIAHGQARSLFSGKKSKRGRCWLEIIKWLNAGEKDPGDKTMFFSHFLLAMCRFQKHMFAILSLLKDHPVTETPIPNEPLPEDPNDCADQ
jgi:hypothetical protein